MLQRLMIHDGQTEEQARKRFDAGLGVSSWAVPGRVRVDEVQPADTRAPWWWSEAEADQSSAMFMEMARAKGMIE